MRRHGCGRIRKRGTQVTHETKARPFAKAPKLAASVLIVVCLLLVFAAPASAVTVTILDVPSDAMACAPCTDTKKPDWR